MASAEESPWALAEGGIKIAVHYYQNERAAKDTLKQVRQKGADGFLVQADVTQPDQINEMFRKVKSAFGKLDIFVSNARTEDSVLNTLPEQVQQLLRNWHERSWTPMGRLGTPEDIGNVVSLFCSEKAGWITGQVIYADGGASLMNPEIPPEIQIG